MDIESCQQLFERKVTTRKTYLEDLYLLVTGLGVCTRVIALVGVDGFCSSNLLDILNGEKGQIQ
jgi:hypothetical protein